MREVYSVKVIFGDTDAMGIVYYGNYFRWFEIGRVELLRKNRITYKDLTDQDIHLPVIESGCRYLKPARYDDELKIFSGIEQVKKARVRFGYTIKSRGVILTTGFTEHVFTDGRGKVIRPPEEIVNKLLKVKHAL